MAMPDQVFRIDASPSRRSPGLRSWWRPVVRSLHRALGPGEVHLCAVDHDQLPRPPDAAGRRHPSGPEDGIRRNLDIHGGDLMPALILPLLGALVTEEGGPLCHAAIVAREFGLPAVVGVKGAMTTITHGSTVEVDPRIGRVHVA